MYTTVTCSLHAQIINRHFHFTNILLPSIPRNGGGIHGPRIGILFAIQPHNTNPNDTPSPTQHLHQRLRSRPRSQRASIPNGVHRRHENPTKPALPQVNHPTHPQLSSKLKFAHARQSVDMVVASKQECNTIGASEQRAGRARIFLRGEASYNAALRSHLTPPAFQIQIHTPACHPPDWASASRRLIYDIPAAEIIDGLHDIDDDDEDQDAMQSWVLRIVPCAVGIYYCRDAVDWMGSLG
ncbi:hypothetical protein R3P38DRAFT_539042 [Favolaschia claudopus]|uniref:Uncharacterized protein n=1 Tax=Favolaschia claudopus TaxID=2862362 RepID=A0AAW0CGG3_9AGAR